MRLALVIYGSLSEQSGGFLYDRELKRGLEALGHHVQVVSVPWQRYLPAMLDNLNRSILLDLASRHVDLVLQDELCHPSFFLSNRRLRRRHELPVVAIVHHLRSSEDHPTVTAPVYETVERMYVRSVDGFLFNSHPTQAAVQALRAKPAPGVVVPPGRDHLEIPRPREGGRRMRGTDEPIQVLFVGSLIHRKGLHTLLDALERVEDGWRLVVAGRVDFEPAYAQRQLARLDRPPFARSSHFYGPVGTEVLQSLYAEADVLAVPSQHEGFGLVYLEAMGFGVPVLASRSGGAHDLVEDGQNGYLIEPGSVEELARALRRYRDDPTLLAAHGRAARARHSKQPSWQKTASTAAAFLREEVLGRNVR